MPCSPSLTDLIAAALCDVCGRFRLTERKRELGCIGEGLDCFFQRKFPSDSSAQGERQDLSNPKRQRGRTLQYVKKPKFRTLWSARPR